MAELTLHIVDAFTDRPFSGNPAAVCLLDQPLSSTRMQIIAAEMNLSETAFLEPRGDAWGLRWFTPGREVDLCGHATLASAHILWEQKLLSPAQAARFSTLSGTLTAVRQDSRITLDFPAEVAEPFDPPPEIQQAIPADIECILANRLHYLVCLRDSRQLRALQPDLRLIAQLPRRGLIVTSPSDDARFDFLSRYFAPAAGVNEDPVTGSAHCSLAPFWSRRLGRREMVGYQASARGGIVGVRDRGERIDLIGSAATVLRSTLLALPEP